MTFRLPESGAPSPGADLHCTLSRCHGLSLEQRVELSPAGAATVWPLAQAHQVDQIHVWSRQAPAPGEPVPEFCQPLVAWMRTLRETGASLKPPFAVNRTARSHQLILDIIQIEPELCWTGLRTACSIAQRWVGGAPRLRPHPEMISRAYFKTKEALLWSRLPMAPGQVVVEIGCAPGGSAQAFLERGLQVVGVDPAQVDARVAQAPGFTHLRMRAAHVKRRLFRDANWLSIDTNVAPQHALDTVERIVTQPQCRIGGLLLTLKLAEWRLTEEIPAYLARIGQWGFGYVKARQLASNRQEICVMALRRKHLRRNRTR